uniref:Uncharacterized protein n=1 Tax=Cacopsylla melanoneura TaxID=428564 RepID=A0A8D9BDC6_9HEMI
MRKIRKHCKSLICIAKERLEREKHTTHSSKVHKSFGSRPFLHLLHRKFIFTEKKTHFRNYLRFPEYSEGNYERRLRRYKYDDKYVTDSSTQNILTYIRRYTEYLY